jgi:diaminopimelate decarboxylase
VSILALLARAGAGFDIVSGGELYRVLQAGGAPERVVFSGVGKRVEEVEYALAVGIHSFNCESEAELALIDRLAAQSNQMARVSVRVNPDVDAATHPYISTGLRDHKFGIDISEVFALYQRAQAYRNLSFEGVSCHIGSQLLDVNPMMEAVDKMIELVECLRAAGLQIRHLDLGGGLGVAYERGQQAPEIAELIGAICKKLEGKGLEVMVEPGRSIVAEAGVLLTRVLYRKRTTRKDFVVVDAAMNDLLRPSLYRSHHEIIPVRQNSIETVLVDVVGPVCETGDFLAKDRELASVFPGDLMAVCTAGAYGFVLASNYNSRPRPPEIMVEEKSWRTVRARESYADLVRGEEAM